MKALQVVQPRSFALVQAPVPQLPTGEPERILVRTAWVSMCGSDIPFFTGSKRFSSYPLPVGAPIHECAGEVVDSNSSQFNPGDRVICIPEGDQGLAEFFTAQAAKAVILPAELSDCDTSCLIQPLSTVMNAVDRMGSVAGRTAAVIGLGSIGLLFCWWLKKCRAAQIVGIDPSGHRCRTAERFGADRTITMRSIEVVHLMRQQAGEWDPPEICIEAVGHQMDTVNDCIELVKKQGTVLAFGVPDHTIYAIEYEIFFRKNAALIAAVTPDWSEYLAKARDVFIAHRQELENLVTHRFPIQEAEKAFTLYANHQDGILKAILDARNWETQRE
jgi:L-iditol 2-dehydrogenase